METAPGSGSQTGTARVKRGMAEIMELIEDSGWVPSGPMNAPPKRPDRNPHPA